MKQLQQRAEVVGAAPLAVACGEEAGALRCVSTPAPCQLSARMCIRRGSFLQIIWTIWAELILQKEPAENCRLMLARSRSRLCSHLRTVMENDKLVVAETLAQGDRWLSPPSYRLQPALSVTTHSWFECLLLRGRRTRERRARVPEASPCWEAGGFRRVFGGLWRLLRGSWSLGCAAAIG